jgi:hypothetical protein
MISFAVSLEEIQNLRKSYLLAIYWHKENLQGIRAMTSYLA